MKEKIIGNQNSSSQSGKIPRGAIYFDGYYFWATTPTASSPSYTIYRNTTPVNSITANTSSAQTSYGVMKPIFKIISSTLYIVVPYYLSSNSNYYVDIYKYPAWDRYTLYSALHYSVYFYPIGVMLWDSKIIVPCVEHHAISGWILICYFYSGTSSSGGYSDPVLLESYDIKRAVGGWDNGTGSFYYIASRDSRTYLESVVVYTGTSSKVKIYQISNTTLVSSNTDNFQWFQKYGDSWFFFDNNGGGVYRGKFDVQDSFSQIIAGTSIKYGTLLNTSNYLIGITKLSGTTLSFYEVFVNGGIEKYNETVSSVADVASVSNYGFVYQISSTWYYRNSTFQTYTPSRNEVFSNNLFESPQYIIKQESGDFNSNLLLADDSNNLFFAGHLQDVKDSTEMPLTELIYVSNIDADLKRKRSETYTSKTDGYILNDILDQGCVQLTTNGGSVTSGGSYDFIMNRMSVLEALRWLFSRTQKLPRWNGVGIVSFNSPSTDSGLDISSSNIIGALSLQKETSKYGLVILEGNNISVQAPVESGGDGVYYDYYPYVDDIDELQAIADNIATMQFNQYEKITVSVKNTGLLDIGDYVDLLYNPHSRIDLDDQYYIVGYEYNPYSNNSLLRLSNALFVDSVLDKDRQVNSNTQKINEIDARTVDTTHSHSNKAVLDAIIDAGSGDIITSGERTAITHSNRSVLDDITNAGSGSIITSGERTTFNGKMSEVSDDSSPTLGGDLELSDNSIIIDYPDTNNKPEGLYQVFYSSAGVTIGHAVRIVATTNHIVNCNVTSSSSMPTPAIGIACASGTGWIKVLLFGVFRSDSTWSWNSSDYGKPLYVSGTTGALSTSPPNNSGNQVQRIGIILFDDYVLVMPSLDVLTR